MKLNSRSLAPGLVVLGLALLPQLAAAEVQQDCLKLKTVETSHETLQPGATYVMILDLEPVSEGCGILLKTAGQSLDYPLSLQLDVPSGLKAEWIRRSYDKLDSFPNTATQLQLALNVTALSQLAPGEYSIGVLLSYDAIDNHGAIYPQQQMTLHLPVKVVVAKTDQQPKSHWWEPLLLIPLVPLAWILGLFFDIPEC